MPAADQVPPEDCALPPLDSAPIITLVFVAQTPAPPPRVAHLRTRQSCCSCASSPMPRCSALRSSPMSRTLRHLCRAARPHTPMAGAPRRGCTNRRWSFEHCSRRFSSPGMQSGTPLLLLICRCRRCTLRCQSRRRTRSGHGRK